MRRKIIQRYGDRDARPKRYSVSDIAYTISSNPMSDTNQQVIVYEKSEADIARSQPRLKRKDY